MAEVREIPFPMNTPTYPLFAALFACVLPSLPAQAPAATASGKSTTEDEALVLSPFTVQAENDGYRATTTVTGTRIVTPVEKLPLSISIITEEMLRDAGLYNIEDALRYTAGAGLDARSQDGRADVSTVNLRGFSRVPVLRNGVAFSAVADSSNIQQVEVARGPSAILYGVVEPGGAVNYVTKRPTKTPSASLRQVIASEHFFRTEWDYNRPLNAKKTMLFRFMGSYQDNESFRWFEQRQNLFANAVFTWQLTPTTLLNLDVTHVQRGGTASSGGFPFLQPNPAQGLTKGIPAFRLPGWDRSYGTASPDNDLNMTNDIVDVRLEQQVGTPLRLQAIWREFFADVDSLLMFMNLSRAAGFTAVEFPTRSQITASKGSFFQQRHQWEQYFEFSGLLQFKLGATRHNLVAGTQLSRVKLLRSYGVQRNVTISAAAPLRELYRGLPVSELIGIATPAFGSRTPTRTGWGGPDIFVTEQVALLDGRLNLLTGWRREDQTNTLQGVDNVYQGGAIWEVVRHVSPYFLIANSIRPNGFNRLTNLPRPPEQSKGWDAGVKFSFPKQALFLNVGFYNIDKHNVTYPWPGVPPPSVDSVLFSDGARSHGIEVDLNWKPLPTIDLALTYANAEGIATIPGQPTNRLPGAVPHSAGLIMRYRIPDGPVKGLVLGSGVRWCGGDIEFFLPGADRSALNQKAPYTLYDAFARYRMKIFGRETDIGVAVKNITDELYIDRSIDIGQPRSYEFSVSAKF